MKKIFKAFMFYLLSLTWGLPMTLFGAIVALGFLITGHKPKRFHYNIYFETRKENWGGFEGGIFFFICKNAPLYLKQHEAGHGIQNLVFGIFTPIIVTIPSAIRWWYRLWVEKMSLTEYNKLNDYYSIWFERDANIWGQKYFKE